MSLSLCLIGNSHIAAIKQAWRSRKPAVADGVSLTFFSAPLRFLDRLELEGNVLVPKSEELLEKLKFTSDGHEQIDLSRYDAFLLAGMAFGLDVPNCFNDFDIVTQNARPPERALVSRSVLSAMLEARLESAHAVRLIDTLRSLDDKPILLCATPFLSARALTEDADVAAQERYRDRDLLNYAVSAAKRAADKVTARRRCELLWQPDSTMDPPGFTKAEFSHGPVRFFVQGNKSPPTDRRHCNEEYGSLMLNSALQRLDAMTGGRVLPNAAARKQSIDA